MELMKKHVDLDRLEVLYEMPFEQAALERDFDVHDTVRNASLDLTFLRNLSHRIISRLIIPRLKNGIFDF